MTSPAVAVVRPRLALLKPEELANLRRKRLGRVYAQICFNLACYVCLSVIVLSDESGVTWLPAWLMQAVILTGFLSAAHSCSHNLMFNSNRANRVAGSLWMIPLGLNFSYYKYFHLQHHSYTGVDGDSEVRVRYRNLMGIIVDLFAARLLRASIGVSAGSWLGQVPPFVRNRLSRGQIKTDAFADLLWLMLVALGLATFPMLSLKCYVMPFFLALPVGVLTSLPEHYGTEDGPDVTRNTRSVKSNWLFRMWYWNDNYHAEHHAYPLVPHYNLGELSVRIRHAFLFTETSYVSFYGKLVWQLFSGQGRPLDGRR